MAAAWELIELACSRRFTGELTLVTAHDSGASTTNVYVNDGLVHLAEDASDPPLATRLSGAGAIPAALRDFVVGGADEDIAALFDLDPHQSREPAEHLIQRSTEAILLEIAALEVLSSTSTADRHHPSGIHRWFGSAQDGSDDPAEACQSTIDMAGLDRIVPTAEPTLIPHLQLATTPSDDEVAAAVSRTVAALEHATETIGRQRPGFVPVPRSPATSH